jgi:hypothetical protein
VQYTLSTAAGSQTVEASAPIVPESNAVAVFTVTANPEPAAELVPAGGDGQTAQVSTALPIPLAVRAVDRFNNGVSGIEVDWQAGGGAEVNPVSLLTGPDGRAAVTVTLGDRPGSYGVLARAQGLKGSPVTFSSTAVAAPKPELVITTQPSSTAAAGVPFAQQPELQLQDPFGAPLNQADVRVTAQIADGGGSVGGRTTAQSDVNGRVRFTDLALRGETGVRTLIFAADGFTPVTSAPIRVDPGPPSDGESSVSVPNGTAGQSTPISIRLRDEFGNSISGAAGDLSVSISGANEMAGLTTTESGGGSYTASYVPLRTGTDVVTMRFRGTPISQAQSLVAPGAADPATSTAVVTRNGVLFVQVDVLVTTRDAQGNLLGHGGDQVLISPNGGPARTAVDNGDGTYSDRFLIVAGTVSVAITLNGVPLAGSPFIP